MVVYYDEDNFSIKLYRDCVRGELVGLTEVIPIDELLEVWQKHKADTTQTEREDGQMNDECEECKLYGDDYRWDAEEQDYVSNCEDCIFNIYRGEYDDE